MLKSLRVTLAAIVSAGVVVCAEVPAASSVRPLWFNEHQICTANSINQHIGLWLTANHCVRGGAPSVEDRSDPDHPFHQTTIVWVSTEDDLAVLYTDSLRVPALALAESAPAVGDDVQYFGYPMAWTTPQDLRGHVSSKDTHITFNNPFGGTEDYGRHDIFAMGVCAGASGSAILDMSGRVVSVVQLGPGDPCTPLTGGVRFERLQHLTARFFDVQAATESTK